MKVTEKQLRRQIKELKSEVETLNTLINDLETDRKIYRDALVSNLRFAVKILGESKYWKMTDMIENFSKTLQKAKWFYW